jgi:diketogulonate reductase-like aldo/keto reductase
MKKISFSDGTAVPALGTGTWKMAEDRRKRAAEIRVLQRSLDLGLSVIDTAEMYGEGASEELAGEALQGRRDQAFLVSKVYPHNAGRRAVGEACERSLTRLRTDRLDLYLLHWRGSVPLAETVEAFTKLQAQGKIRRWGVSNLDSDDMEELVATAGGEACAANQVLYNPIRRGIEWDLLPWCERRSMPVMAYSPIEQGRLPSGKALDTIGERRGLSRYQVAIAWVLRYPDVIAIPKTSSPDRLEANAAAAEVTLDQEELAAIDRDFPPPRRKQPLAML